jgi:hypothetical protein
MTFGARPDRMRVSLRCAGLLLVSAIVVSGFVTSCAGRPVAGTGAPGSTTTGPAGTIGGVPTSTAGSDLPTSACPEVTATPGGPPVATPTGKPMITVTQGTNSWVASGLTQPFAVAVYPDGTAIRTEDQGILSEPLPEMTIGRLDQCRLQEAVAEIERLAGVDLGEASVTDQGTTTITLHPVDAEGVDDADVADDPDVVLEVYALGVGDEMVKEDQRAARQQLAAVIDNLTSGMSQTATWMPDRLRVSAYGTPAELSGSATWPLAGPISTALNRGDRVPCGVFDGADAAAIRAELGSGRAATSWTDGMQTVVLAIGVLVPGQGCSGT